MFRKLLPAALIAASVALVAAGSAALAIGMSDRSSDGDLIDRVAAKLGLEPQAVSDALTQAQREQVKERQDEALAKLVTAGVITQEESDSASAWLGSRPEAADRLLSGGRLLPLALGRGVPFIIEEVRIPGGSSLGNDELLDRMAELLGVDPQTLRDAVGDAESAQAKDRRTEALNSFVDTLVEQGELTEAEGADIKAWLAEMPDWIAERGGLSILFAGLPAPIFDSGPFGFGGPAPDFNFPIPQPRQFDPDGADRFHFEFNGPDGKFEFNGEPGEFPDDIQEMLDEMELRFQFGEGGADLFRGFRPFAIPEPEVTPETGDAGSTGSDA